VQVFPARDGKANWCELRVLGTGACFAVRRG
jgi:hypothetical protein